LRGRVGDNPIAAITLGAVERLIGTLEDELGRIVGEFEGGNFEKLHIGVDVVDDKNACGRGLPTVPRR
jgi:hypothetical protein